MSVADDCAAEIVRLHDIITTWTTGAVPATDREFAAFEAALAPGFVIINPEGYAESRDTVVSRFRDRHGARASRDFRIAISNIITRQLFTDRALLTYHEHWLEGGREASIILSTALMQRQPDLPNGIAWLHLHETWLRPPG